MVQKNKKPIKKGQYIRCKYCNEKLYINELLSKGYAEKYNGKLVINCPECDGQFIE